MFANSVLYCKLVNIRTKLFLIFVLAACGCGRYADFTLPQPDSAGPGGAFHWRAQAAPVLGRGPEGAWDSSDVLNPSVVRFGGRYINLYSGFDGATWHTGIADSLDGVLWTKRQRVLSPAGWEG